VASRIPQGLFMGLVFGLMLVGTVSSLFPLTPGTTALLVLGVACVAIYAAGLVTAIRVRRWLRRRS
jgi:uncharacterized protein YqgC (DUF456 family)